MSTTPLSTVNIKMNTTETLNYLLRQLLNMESLANDTKSIIGVQKIDLKGEFDKI